MSRAALGKRLLGKTARVISLMRRLTRRKTTMVTLPTGFKDTPTRSRGRNVQAGYQRGWGLQFSDLTGQLHQDKLYNEALQLSHGRTVVSEANRMNLYLIIRFGLEGLAPGHITEFGTYRGGNALFMARLCQELHPGMNVYAFDTYEGMPETDSTRDAHKKGDFKDAGYEEILRLIDKHKLDNLKLVRGLFEDTAPTALPDIGKIRINHIDCDIYSGVKYSYDASRPHMVEGGYWVFDDSLYSSCIGAMEAVEEVLIQRDGRFAEQVYPHLVYRNFSPKD
jgi:Macrocin-O-methyltransferase (TylF)